MYSFSIKCQPLLPDVLHFRSASCIYTCSQIDLILVFYWLFKFFYVFTQVINNYFLPFCVFCFCSRERSWLSTQDLLLNLVDACKCTWGHIYCLYIQLVLSSPHEYISLSNLYLYLFICCWQVQRWRYHKC